MFFESKIARPLFPIVFSQTYIRTSFEDVRVCQILEIMRCGYLSGFKIADLRLCPYINYWLFLSLVDLYPDIYVDMFTDMTLAYLEKMI